VVTHPSAVGRAQDRKRSPVKDQRSTTVSYNQLHPYACFNFRLPLVNGPYWREPAARIKS